MLVSSDSEVPIRTLAGNCYSCKRTIGYKNGARWRRQRRAVPHAAPSKGLLKRVTRMNLDNICYSGWGMRQTTEMFMSHGQNWILKYHDSIQLEASYRTLEAKASKLEASWRQRKFCLGKVIDDRHGVIFTGSANHGCKLTVAFRNHPTVPPQPVQIQPKGFALGRIELCVETLPIWTLFFSIPHKFRTYLMGCISQVFRPLQRLPPAPRSCRIISPKPSSVVAEQTP